MSGLRCASIPPLPGWPIDRADAVLSINMVHISPWASALGLLDGAARLLRAGVPLILYGPGSAEARRPRRAISSSTSNSRRATPVGTAPVEDSLPPRRDRGLDLAATRAMPANNLMLFCVRIGSITNRACVRRMATVGPKSA